MLVHLRRSLVALAVAAGLAGPASAAPDLRLVMVEQPGCTYCQQWHSEIGPIYPKTPEGAAAPLEVMRLNAPPPDGITFESPPVFTPTFVLVRDGAEIARIEGYPGEDFFWGLLGQMLTQSGNWTGP